MTTLRLYRGVSVPLADADGTISTVVRHGLNEEQGHRYFEQSWGLPIAQLAQLAEKADLSTTDTRSSSSTRPALCACGTVEGATYYALQHNLSSINNTPIIIEFNAKLDSVAVDGRDFLYTAFQFGKTEKVRSTLKELFGSKILFYFDAARVTKDQDRRVALCDLATIDPCVVNAHYKNRSVIFGRYGTVFENAFTVSLPISPRNIINVSIPTNRYEIREPSVTLGEIL